MSFADVKAKARRDVHTTLAVRCLYTPPYAPVDTLPVELTARLHTKVVTGGAQSAGYAQVIEGVTRAIFDVEELLTKEVILKKNGRVEFPDYSMIYQLDTISASDGPVTQKWLLSSL